MLFSSMLFSSLLLRVGVFLTCTRVCYTAF